MKANDRAGKGNFVIKLQHTLYITEPDLVLKKDGQTLRAVHSDGHSDHIPLHMVDQIVTYSGGSITPDVLGACATAGVGFSSFSQCGRFQFRIVGATTGNVLLRKRQYEQSGYQSVTVPARGKRRSAAGGGRSEPLSRKHPDWQTRSGCESAGATVSADCIFVVAISEVKRKSCRPREGCGLHQQKDTNPYRHFDAPDAKQ